MKEETSNRDKYAAELAARDARNREPDWPPRASAYDKPDGYAQRGSSGQLFIVRKGRWERVME